MPADAYMRHQTGSPFTQVMSYRLFVTEPLPDQYRLFIDWIFMNNLNKTLNQNTKMLSHENAFESIVCRIRTELIDHLANEDVHL